LVKEASDILFKAAFITTTEFELFLGIIKEELSHKLNHTTQVHNTDHLANLFPFISYKEIDFIEEERSLLQELYTYKSVSLRSS